MYRLKIANTILTIECIMKSSHDETMKNLFGNTI